ncbi:GNAT family N-acetyltransferase [Herbaspirillum sp. B65]|uniref:GNAT family N-acetyltransferase n=1 Tax=Herbaspirillum sp. B65 TaxID=137708 RepID=UPI0005CB1307|nr:GNAT family N-acetyltransferase [Herbaspirillum sp. B65]
MTLPAPEDLLLRGSRVLLRNWRAEDRQALAAINADVKVMQHFPACLTRVQSDAMANKIEEHFIQHGFGPWVLEIPGMSEFAGLIGLMQVGFEAHFTPAVEIAWRLAPAFWGQGYITEAARYALDFGFLKLGLPQIVAFTVPANKRSLAVMQRLGMTSDVQEDFQHPCLPDGHPLRLHHLYRIQRAQWMQRQQE